MDTLLNISPRMVEGKGKGESPDDIVYNIAQNFEKQISKPLEFSPSENPISLEVFRNQELERFNILVARMRGSLNLLQKAIRGLVVMS